MRKRNAQRGSTIIEVMCAAGILLVAIVGLVAVMNSAASATAVGHRRTVGAHLRQAVIDRVLVTPRDRLEPLADGTWRIDGCYDVDAREITPPAGGWSPKCPPEARYQTGFRIDALAERSWRVLTYAERLTGNDATCNSAKRLSSVSCLGADLLLTD